VPEDLCNQIGDGSMSRQRAHYSQYRGMELAGLLVTAIRIARVTSLGNLSVELATVRS